MLVGIGKVLKFFFSECEVVQEPWRLFELERSQKKIFRFRPLSLQ